MDTSPISYRVADFLKQHPPFQAMDDADLLELAARGRVRFHEANEFILWQGEPHKSHVFVIQQGVVTLWDETEGVWPCAMCAAPGTCWGSSASSARHILSIRRGRRPTSSSTPFPRRTSRSWC